MKTKMVRMILKYIIVFALTISVMLSLLVLSAMVPKKLIQNNIQESAEYIHRREQNGHYLIKGNYSSFIDDYADVVILSILYYYDSKRPVESAMWSKYYYIDHEPAGEKLLETVCGGKEANLQYLRYWHGSTVPMTFFHLFWNIGQIYVFHGIVLIVLLCVLIFLLARRRYKTEIAAIFIGLLMVSPWFAAICLEYYWCFLIMLIVSIIGILMVDKGKNEFSVLFFLSGMITVYMDFLTCETLTLLVPLLLILRITCKRGRDTNIPAVTDRESWLLSAKAIISWLIGYGVTWATKWLIASIVLHQNVMPLVTGHIAERIGNDQRRSLIMYMLIAAIRNIQCLFPLSYKIIGPLVTLTILAAFVCLVAIGRIKLRDTYCWNRIALFVCIGVVPYVRYIVLHNHSWKHCIFTYRAQMATVMALCFIIGEFVKWDKTVIRRKGGRER